MNRRGFLNSILRAGAGAAILPPATTYIRAAWKRTDDQSLFVQQFFFNSQVGIISHLYEFHPITTIEDPVYRRWMDFIYAENPNYSQLPGV